MSLWFNDGTMNLIDSVFRRLRETGRKAFMPFLTAGDPDVDGTVRRAAFRVVVG